MLKGIIHFSIRQRWLVLLATIAMAGLGIYNFGQLPIDAVPDITNVQVQVNTAVQGLSPVEIEQQITFPIEIAMAGLPDLLNIRSISRYGLSQVTVIFEEGTNIYWARQLVGERLTVAKESLPEGVAEPEMGPISTGLGEIFMWAIEAAPEARRADGQPYDSMDLRTIQDWVIRPRLRMVEGVNEVNSIGGYERQFHVTPEPMKLVSLGLSFSDVMEALAANNGNAGGGYIEHFGSQYLIRTTGRLKNQDDIRNVVVGTRHGVPVRIADVARVGLGKELRTGAATSNGKEAVVGTAIMLLGANSRVVSQSVGAALEDIGKSLPDGVTTTTLYDRTYLVDATLKTVRTNLTEGALLVVAVLFLLLGNLRAAFIVAMAIPLSMLFAVTGMVRQGISGNLMSMGAIDFGIIVDGAVVMVENIIRRFSHRQESLGRTLSLTERLDEAYRSAAEVGRPTFFGVLIIMIVYLPVLTLTGVEGKMFRPMAGVVLLALTGALLLTFTFVPAAVSLFLSGSVSEKENPLMKIARRIYEPLLRMAVRLRYAVVILAVGLLAICTWQATSLGSEFVPELGEGALAVQPARIPAISLSESLRMQEQLEKALLEAFPDEISHVFARTGTAEVATDPMGPNVSDTYLMLHPRERWTKAENQEELAEKMEEVLLDLPGQNYEFSQPIELRFNELISGVRSDLAVKVFGDDMDLMLSSAQQIAKVLQKVPGAADIKVEQVSGLPVLTIDVDREAAARRGLNGEAIQEVVRIAIGGAQAGLIFDGDRRFPLVVRLPDAMRPDLEALESLPVLVPDGGPQEEVPHGRAGALERRSHAPQTTYVPLGSVATFDLVEGPNQVSRENGKRRIVVQANVRGRDIGSFVAEAQTLIDRDVRLPEGYWITWGGQFENLIAARQRLMVVVPVAILLIFMLLYATFDSVKHSLLVFSGVPLALTGGILALQFRGMPFSISAGVGFIALSGVAVLNGLVMMTFINQLRDEGLSLEAAIHEGAVTRLRPVLMTALVASLGFVPMALATSMGAEVQRPLATVVIGGLVSSTLLTLLVLPALYRISHQECPTTGSSPDDLEEGKAL